MAQTKVKLISDGVIVQGNLHASHGITTAHIGEGSNLYYTDARVGSYLSTNSFATESYVGTQIANLVDSSPSALNTLNELAAALGDDANFSTTVTNSIALKAPIASPTFTGFARAPYIRATASGDIALGGISGISRIQGNSNQDIRFLNSSNQDLLTLVASTRGATFTGTIASNNIAVTNSGNGELSVTRTSGATVKSIAQSARGQIGTSSNHELQLITNATSRLTIDTSGNSTFAGDVIQSGASKSLKYWRRLWTDANNDWGLNNNAGSGVISVSGMGTPSTSTTTFAGTVGIGESASQGKLDILNNGDYDSHTGHGLAINSYAGNAYTSMYMGADDTIDAAYIQSAGRNTSFTTKTLLLNPNGGNVGIGVTPTAHYGGYEVLDIGNSLSLISNNTSTNVSILTNNAYLNSGATAWVRKANDEATMYEQVSGEHRFSNAGSADAGVAISWSERMRIDSSGNVTIKKTDSSTYSTTTPVSDLLIERKNTDNTNGETVGIRFAVTGWSGSTTGGAAIQAIQTSNVSSADLAFLTRNSGVFDERMRIDSSGNVGIGNISPNNKLEISDTGTGYGTTYLKISRGADSSTVARVAGIKMGNTASNDGSNWIVQAESSLGYFDNADLNFYHNAAGTSTSKFKIKKNAELVSQAHEAGSSGFVLNSLPRLTNSGYVGGNATLSVTYDCSSQGSFFVQCVFNHYGNITSYGCARVFTLANGPGGIEQINIQNVTSGAGGSWTVTKVSNSRFTITKTAGTYGGGGHWFVNIVGNGLKYT